MSFKSFISSLTKTLRLAPTAAELLIQSGPLSLLRCAFTHPNADPDKNYEMYEQLGDVTITKFMVNYFYQRFPELQNQHGVKIVARLRIKYGSRQVLSRCAERMNFWEQIRISADITSAERKAAVMEDVFEAFIGAVEIIVDEHFGSVGTGYAVSYYILKRIYDEIPIALIYENLFDSKTRLKELGDSYKGNLGEILYKSERRGMLTNIVITRNGAVLAQAANAIKADAEQAAAEQALKRLKALGFERTLPKEYQMLSSCKNK